MNTRLLIFVGIFFTILAIFASACQKPTPFGSELLEDEYADSEFTDTITVQCTMVREDSVITSDKSAAAYFLCGEINDPVMGKYSSDIYSLLLAETLNPKFDTATLDSIVLYLKYAPTGFYGDTVTAPQTLRVFRLGEKLNRDSSYYSTASLPVAEELGRIDNFFPRPSRKDSLFEGNEGAFIRIRLSDDFGNELLNLDSLSWLSDSSFFQKLKGLKITASTNGAKPGAMMAFDLNDNALSRVALYYKSDTAQKRFDFYFRNVNKFTHFEHNYTGSEVAPYLDQDAGEKLYLQGMHGVKIKVTFPYANNFDNIAVNKAQLVFTIADNSSLLTPADQLIFTEPGSALGTFNFTNDVVFSLGTTGTGTLKTFGGFPEKELISGVPINRYRMTLSDKFQDIVADDASPNIKNRTVYVNVYPRNRSAKRAVLFGPKSSTFPAKLELKYTRVK